MLTKLIDNAKGALGYSYKMIIAFNFIYNMITGSLIRVTVVAAPGTLRMIMSWVQALIDFVFRIKEMQEFRRNWAKMQQEGNEHGLQSQTYLSLRGSATRACLGVMGDLFDSSITNIAFVGMSCYFSPDMGMDSDCEDGFLVSTVMDAYPEWIINFIEVLFLVVYIRMPSLYFFAMLDPFIVICTLVVIYVDVSLVVFTSAITI